MGELCAGTGAGRDPRQGAPGDFSRLQQLLHCLCCSHPILSSERLNGQFTGCMTGGFSLFMVGSGLFLKPQPHLILCTVLADVIHSHAPAQQEAEQSSGWDTEQEVLFARRTAHCFDLCSISK